MLDRDNFDCAPIASCTVIIRKSGFDALGKPRVKPGKYVLACVLGIVFALKYSKFWLERLRRNGLVSVILIWCDTESISQLKLFLKEAVIKIKAVVKV